MNPPYDRSLHLKILNNMIETFPEAEIVNLSPIEWVMNPAPNNNMTKYGDLKLDIDYVGLLRDLFEGTSGATYHLGIYHTGSKSIESQRYNYLTYDRVNLLEGNLKDFIVKLEKHDNLQAHIKFGKLSDKYCYIIPRLVGNIGKTFDCFIWPKESKWDRIFYKGLSDGKGPGEYKTKFSNVSNYTDFNYVEFDTKEEVENFKSTYKTKFMRFCLGIQSIDSNLRVRLLPYMPTYTHSWTDQDLYEYFGLTDEEIRMILLSTSNSSS